MTVPPPSGDESTSGRNIVSAIRLTSFTSILTIAFGIATNKIIAVVAATEGVGLLGLYRSFTGILTSVLPLGANDTVVQRLSTSHDRGTHEKVVGAGLILLVTQIVALFACALFGAGLIARWLFSGHAASEHLWEIRFVLAVAVGILALQSVSAALNGLLRLREVNLVNLVTSCLTLLMVYPFLMLGRVGLAFIIGFGCFVGAALGFYFLQRALGRPLHRLERPGTWRAFRATLPLSPWLALQPLLNTGSALVVQIVLTRHFGLERLGHYNAAAMLETTAVMVLMASMRSYYLPVLGRLATFPEKRLFVNKILSVLLVLLLAGAMVLVLGAPIIVRILFSAAFQPAEDLVRILAISIAGQVLVWCSAMFLLHGADYRTYLLLDLGWAAVRVTGTVLCAVWAAPVEAVAWVHAGSYGVSAICYTFALRAKYGAFLIDRMNTLFLLLVIALLVGAKLFALNRPLPDQIVFAVTVALLAGVAGNRAWRRLRG